MRRRKGKGGEGLNGSGRVGKTRDDSLRRGRGVTARENERLE